MNVLERIKTFDFNNLLSISLKPYHVDRDGYHSESYMSDSEAVKELITLAELGKLAIQTELCYWGYQYNDGDCNEEKHPCVRNELCKMKRGV